MDLPPPKLVVGLGNPGPRFSNTRHNVGAMAVKHLVNKLAAHEIAANQIPVRLYAVPDRPELYLMTPLVYMNEVGPAVAAVMKKLNVKPEEILVIHDDLDLPPGEMKTKNAGSASGHNGVRSIIAALGTDQFPRLRLGIGRPFPHKPTTPEEETLVSKYVLEQLLPEEQKKIDLELKTIILP